MSAYQRLLVADIGSTITKIALFETHNSVWRVIADAEVPTTIEEPEKQVIVGVRNAIRKIEKSLNIIILENGKLIIPIVDEKGIDAFVATSSAGGGLQMIVAGVVHDMSAASAKKAASGAGALVLRTISAGNILRLHERMKEIKNHKPDIVLLAGGTEGGNVKQVTALAELLGLAQLRPRFGEGKLPVVYAGNTIVRDKVASLLGDDNELRYAENIRPMLEEETIETVYDVIHQLYSSHVISQAPGYDELLEWSNEIVLPTASSTREVVGKYAAQIEKNVLTVDIGGTTTDIVSSIESISRKTKPNASKAHTESTVGIRRERKVHSSVSANLGMSYSAASTLMEAEFNNIARWLSFEISAKELYDWCFNKMLFPESMPRGSKDLMIEHALAREAIRRAFKEHQEVAAKLRGVAIVRSMSDIFEQENDNKGTVATRGVFEQIIGTGGVLVHAPKHKQAMQILVDSIRPSGITEVYLDTSHVLSKLGVIETLGEDALASVTNGGYLVPLGTVLSPVGDTLPWVSSMATVEVEENGTKKTYTIEKGKEHFVSVDADHVMVQVVPHRKVDIGAGVGKPVERHVTGGTCGLLLDGRPKNLNNISKSLLRTWYAETNLYDCAEGRGTDES